MKKIGVLGGVGWRSTVEYYSAICRRSEQRYIANHLQKIPHIPEMCIESLDLGKAVSYLGKDDDEQSWRLFDEYHAVALKRLEEAGADFAIMASNSPHHRFDSIVRDIKMPIINIFDVVAEETARLNANEVLILGTSLTMSSPRFREAFDKRGVKAGAPEALAARGMVEDLIRELQNGDVTGSEERLANIARMSFAGRSVKQPTVCLACTELPLAFQDQKSLPKFVHEGILFLNTTAMHVDAALDFAVQG